MKPVASSFLFLLNFAYRLPSSSCGDGDGGDVDGDEDKDLIDNKVDTATMFRRSRREVST